MASRRMFSLKVIDTDEFLDMPMSSQFLYFNLAMRADDDGFVGNPKKITRLSGCGDDDIKVLIAKKFVIPFESGICVIRHWRIHNYIQKDRYNETEYKQEMASLAIINNKYEKPQQTLLENECIQNVYTTDTQVRLGKDRLGKDRLNKDIATQGSQKTSLNNIIDLFEPLNPSYEMIYRNKTQRSALERMVKKFGEDEMIKIIKVLPKIVGQKYAPRVTTPFQLETKLGEIKIFLQQQSLGDESKKSPIIK